MNNKFLVPVGKDNNEYFDIFEKYKKYIGGVYIGWPEAPSGRVGAAPSRKFFNKVFTWCVKNNKIFDILFNMQAHDFSAGFNFKQVNLKPYQDAVTQLTFSSVALYLEKVFNGFRKSISTNFKVNSIQQLHILSKQLPDLHTVVLDRDVNRNQKLVNQMADFTSKKGINLDVMVNEGCIAYCPYKIDHNIFVTLDLFSDQKKYIQKFKDTCLAYLKSDPVHILMSPFITRDNLEYYNARFFKIVGRKKPPQLIDRILAYYIHNKPIDIGLVFCNKSMSLGITTDMLPDFFHKAILYCQNKCYQCDTCKKTYEILRQINT